MRVIKANFQERRRAVTPILWKLLFVVLMDESFIVHENFFKFTIASKSFKKAGGSTIYITVAISQKRFTEMKVIKTRMNFLQIFHAEIRGFT